MSELGFTSHLQRGHTKTGPWFKVSSERLGKQGIDLVIAELVSSVLSNRCSSPYWYTYVFSAILTKPGDTVNFCDSLFASLGKEASPNLRGAGLLCVQHAVSVSGCVCVCSLKHSAEQINISGHSQVAYEKKNAYEKQ